MGRLLPIRKPTSLAADNVHERVSHGTKPAAQIARELLNAERGDRLQNSVVCPAVVLVEELNVIVSHGWAGSPSGNLTLPCHSAGICRREGKGASEEGHLRRWPLQLPILPSGAIGGEYVW